MDGDSLGKQMSDPKKQTAITEGLAKFTDGVNEIVYRQNGFLIYAGGDDVLALLPLEKALPCASELRQFYLNCFKQGETVLVPTTLSGAIEYVHIKTPLTKVLRDAHHLLDGVAKDITGRDAIAIRVWKPGGLQQQWSQPWEIALIDTTQEHPISYLEQLVYDFRRLEAEDKQFSSKFFYKLRQLFSLLNPPKDDENCHPKQGEPSQKERLIIRQRHEDVIDLVAMEYINSGSTTALSNIKDAKKRKKIARDAVFPLLKQCRPVFRQVDIPQAEKWQCDVANWQRSHFLNADAALLVRFLALKGIEK